jgi:hypothetical protein
MDLHITDQDFVIYQQSRNLFLDWSRGETFLEVYETVLLIHTTKKKPLMCMKIENIGSEEDMHTCSFKYHWA